MRNGMLSLCLIAGMLPGGATAQQQEAGWYGGFDHALSSTDLPAVEMNALLMSRGFEPMGDSYGAGLSGLSLFGGYQVNRFLGFELHYSDFSEAPSMGASGPAGDRTKAVAAALDAVGNVPISRSFSIFGKAGATYWDVSSTLSRVDEGISAETLDIKKQGTDYKFGGGAAFRLRDRLEIQVEYDRYYRIGEKELSGDSGVDLFSVGLRYEFE